VSQERRLAAGLPPETKNAPPGLGLIGQRRMIDSSNSPIRTMQRRLCFLRTTLNLRAETKVRFTFKVGRSQVPSYFRVAPNPVLAKLVIYFRHECIYAPRGKTVCRSIRP